MLCEIGIGIAGFIGVLGIQGNTTKIVRFEELNVCDRRLNSLMDGSFGINRSHKLVFHGRSTEVTIYPHFLEGVFAYTLEDGCRHAATREHVNPSQSHQ